CESAFLAYWDSSASVVPLVMPRPSGGPPEFQVAVNGELMRAIIDSGAARSTVDLRAAARVGVTPQSPGVVPARAAVGVGRPDAPMWMARFDTLEIGSERISSPTMALMDIGANALIDSGRISAYESVREQPEVVLGADFLQTHRVLIAISQAKLYFSKAG